MSVSEEVRQRKIGPIYDAIDSGNNRQAMKLCDKRDIAEWDITKALKATALARVGGHKPEALELCREVMARRPTEEDVHAALGATLRALEAFEDLRALYEDVARQRPGDPAVLREVFLAAVCARDFLRAQQAAARLFKADAALLRGGAAAASRHMFCAAACVLIQSRRRDGGGGGGGAMLPLAERLVAKAIEDREKHAAAAAARGAPAAAAAARHTGEEIELYVALLRAGGKHAAALEALSRLRGAGDMVADVDDEASVAHGTVVAMAEAERGELEVALLRQLGEDTRALATVRGLLAAHRDQWSYYVLYLDLTEKLLDNDDQVWERWLDAQQLICSQQAAEPKLRGPRLAELELLKRIISRGGPEAALPADWPTEGAAHQSQPPGTVPAAARLQALVRAYFNAFCDKQCCFLDLKPYLTLLRAGAAAAAQELRQWFLEQAAGAAATQRSGDAEEDEASRAEALSRLRRYTCAQQVLRFLRGGSSGAKGPDDGAAAAAAAAAALAQELVAQYRATLHLLMDDGQRKVQEGDGLLVLAALTLQDLAALYEADDALSTAAAGAAAAAAATNGHGSAGHQQQQQRRVFLLRVETAALLEYGVRLSPCNYQLKMLAMQVYERLGSFARGVFLYNDMGTKQIQVESLSYLLYPGCLRAGLFTEAAARSKNVMQLHRSCARDTRDYMGTACLQGNYSKALDMAAFQERRMDCSLQLALAKAQLVHLELLEHRRSLEYMREYIGKLATGQLMESVDVSDAELAELSDNLDRTVLPHAEYAPCGTAGPASPRLRAALRCRLLANAVVRHALLNQADAALPRAIARLRCHLRCFHGLTLGSGGSSGGSDVGVGDDDAAAVTEELARALGEFKLEEGAAQAAAAEEEPCCARARAGDREGWALMLQCAEAVGAADAAEREAAGEGGAAAALAAAAAAMSAAAEHAVAARKELLTPGWSHIIIAADASSAAAAAAAAPMTAEWLRAASTLVARIGGDVMPLLQALVGSLAGAAKRARKSKKSKAKRGSSGGGAGGGGGAGEAAAAAALATLGDAVVKLLKGLGDVLRAEAQEKCGGSADVSSVALATAAEHRPSAACDALLSAVQGGGGGGSAAAYAPLLPFLTEAGALGVAAQAVMAGQGISAQRLLELVRDMSAALLEVLPGR